VGHAGLEPPVLVLRRRKSRSPPPPMRIARRHVEEKNSPTGKFGTGDRFCNAESSAAPPAQWPPAAPVPPPRSADRYPATTGPNSAGWDRLPGLPGTGWIVVKIIGDDALTKTVHTAHWSIVAAVTPNERSRAGIAVHIQVSRVARLSRNEVGDIADRLHLFHTRRAVWGQTGYQGGTGRGLHSTNWYSRPGGNHRIGRQIPEPAGDKRVMPGTAVGIQGEPDPSRR